MIEYNFTGENNSHRYGVTLFYDQVNNSVSALTTAGGIPAIQYSNVYPSFNEGALMLEKWEAGFLYKLFWSPLYPFATSQKIATPVDPGLNYIEIDNLVVTNETAEDANNGSITITASGGALPYEYSLNGIEWYNASFLNGLPPQPYTVFVRTIGGAGLPATGNFVVLPYSPPAPPATPPIKDIVVESGGEINIQNAYKRVEVLSVFGKVPTILYNGDFESWDGNNFSFWARYGGLDFSRVQRTITDTNGVQTPIQNWALRFNVKSETGKYLESAPIPVTKGYTAKIQYRVSKTVDVSESSYRELIVSFPTKIELVHNLKTFYACKIRIKVGNYYLYNENYSSTYTWVKNLSTVSNAIYNPTGDLSTYTFGFQIPEYPESGNMVIQLYGFQKIQMDSHYVEGKSVTDKQEGTDYTPLNDYNPVTIDNISLSSSSQNDDNDITGMLSISQNTRYYTEKPDQFKILFGDYFNSASGASAVSNLYAIKIGKIPVGQPSVNLPNSTGWFEYGISTSPVPFGLALAKSILRAYQKPFRFWLGNFKLKPSANEFSYLNTFCFDVPGQAKFSSKVFAILGGEIDLKYNEISNLKLAEIFDKPAKSIDITVPNYPGTTPPIFVQDPNGDDFNNNGIFTEQFTPEFT